MALTTKIYLTETAPTVSGWQQENDVQLFQDDIYIVGQADAPYLLRKIQKAGRKIEELGVKQAQLVGDNWSVENQWAFAMGFTCVGKLTSVVFTGEAAEVSLLNDKLAVYAWSRDLINQTPAQLYPEQLAQLSADYIQGLAPNAVSYQIISGDDLVKAGWTGIYHVGKASQHPPCLLVLDYNPSQQADAAVTSALVGKGITFDSGGYSLKPSDGMFDMKGDMGGAAVTAGALALAIKQGLNQRVKLFLCCAENMVAGNAYKLGDILTYKNGVTVEIANTDAEGRLVLADGLMAATDSGAELIIDAATLTGAAVAATGGDYTALFALDQTAAEQAKQAATEVNEPVWQLPLETWHQDKCPSAFADTANSRTVKGGGAGGASNAAGFLSRFVPPAGQGQQWLHFDLAADYNSSANSLWAAGATGQGIAVIAQLLLR